MKKWTTKTEGTQAHKKRLCGIGVLCWILAPIATITLLVLDGTGVYTFNTERLLVIGACTLIALTPFFKEISVNNFSIKKDNNTVE